MAKRTIKKAASALNKGAAVTADKLQITENPEDALILWKIHTGSLWLEGKRYEAGDTFEAPESKISKAFRDTVKPVVSTQRIVQRPVIKFSKVEVEVTDEERAVDGFAPLYNVVNLSGAVINPIPLEEENADELLEQWNG